MVRHPCFWLLPAAAVLALASLRSADIPAQPEPSPPPALQARRVTLTQDQITLPEALAAIEKQTGVHVGSNPDAAEIPFRLDLVDRTFWEALDAVANATGSQPYAYARDGRLTLTSRPKDQKAAPLSYAGPFRVSLKRLVATQDFETGGHSYSATLEVLWEPTLKPLYLDVRPHHLTLKGDREIAVTAEPEGSSPAPLDGRLGRILVIGLPPVGRTNARLETLSGSLMAIVPGKMVPFAFPGVDALADGKGRALTVDGLTCRVTDVSVRDDQWTFKLQVQQPVGIRLESNQSWVVNNELVLVSPDGKRRLASSRYTLNSAGAQQANLTYVFTGSREIPLGKPADWRLHYTTPGSIVTVPVPFSFTNIPLP